MSTHIMPASSQGQDYSQVKILIIEDDPSARKVIGEYLSTKGFQTLEAEDGKAGLNLFSKESPDLILLDLRLPVMDGLEVLVRISKDAPAYSDDYRIRQRHAKRCIRSLENRGLGL